MSRAEWLLMPGTNGIEATRRIVLSGVESRVLILTTFDLDEYFDEALRMGASGFLLKDVTAAQLVEGVRVVAVGEAMLAPCGCRKLGCVVCRLVGRVSR
jgi:DNA-binding NarL/FixJ family response regulator